MGWYYYLEGKLRFPFTATCIKRRATSPFKIGESLPITGLAPEEDCMSEIIVITKYHGRALGVPLAQLRPRKVDAATKEAIEDWHYWIPDVAEPHLSTLRRLKGPGGYSPPNIPDPWRALPADLPG
jgi:hypothetical protein